MWYVILLAVCIGGDQLLKWWVTSHLDVGQSAPLLPGIIRLTRLHNTGAAWSSFSGKTGLLAAVTIVLMAAVVYLVVKKIVRHAGAWRRRRQHDRPSLPRLRGGYV